MSAKSYVSMSFHPREGVSPRTRLSPYAGSIGIPVIELSGQYDSEKFDVALGHEAEELDDSVRYLRELAEQATRLADEIEQRRSES